MSDEKAVFLAAARDAADGRDGNFEFSCPLCSGYCIGTRKSWFNSILATCLKCGLIARGEIITEKGA